MGARYYLRSGTRLVTRRQPRAVALTETEASKVLSNTRGNHCPLCRVFGAAGCGQRGGHWLAWSDFWSRNPDQIAPFIRIPPRTGKRRGR